MHTLLQLSVRELGRQLCWVTHPVPELADIPEVELAVAVWRAWQGCLASPAASGAPLPSLNRQQQVLAAFAAAFWHPQLLRLAFSSAIPPGLASLPLVAHQLLHLELAAPGLGRLDTVVAACPQLRCLSLRGCTGLGDASLEVLGLHLTSLQALDLSGLPALTDGACFHIAKLPCLAALNLSGTSVGDGSVQLLTYGARVRAWQRAQGVPSLPPEAEAWPLLPLEHIQLAGTRVGAEGVAELARLPNLRFLDMRHTGIARHVLGPLQRRFALQFVQAAVLSSSNQVAVAAINENAVVCRCGVSNARRQGKDGVTELLQWEAEGVQSLLHWSEAHSHRGWPTNHAATAAIDAQPMGVPGGRRVGYREPRRGPATGGKRKWPL